MFDSHSRPQGNAHAERALARSAAGHPAQLAEVRLRFGAVDDAAALRGLAALDSARVPQPPLLVAEVEGELRAALSLRDGRTIADPFRPTADLVELLELRARAIGAASGPSATRGRVRRHLSLTSSRVVAE